VPDDQNFRPDNCKVGPAWLGVIPVSSQALPVNSDAPPANSNALPVNPDLERVARDVSSAWDNLWPAQQISLRKHAAHSRCVPMQ
jgi:hypothetical protein